MAFLDFIKNRPAGQQQDVAENTQEKKTERPNVQNLPAEVKAQAVEAAHPAAKLMDRATQHRAEAPSGHASHSDGKEALIRNQGDQGKEQSAMSPTDHSKSQTATQERTQGRGRGMER
jgi:hypothetical protein